MSTVALLLSPFWLSWKNSLSTRSGSWSRRLVLAALAVCFWLGTYFIIRRVLRYFETVYELGPALAYQLLLIILLTFLSMLLFSNLVASLSTFFLARDLELLHAAPVSRESFPANSGATVLHTGTEPSGPFSAIVARRRVLSC